MDTIIYATVAGALVGAIATWVLSRVTAKRAVFRCIRSEEHFNKNENPDVGFGLELIWNGTNIDNFTITRFRVTNDGAQDFKNVPVRISSSIEAMLLQDSARNIESADPIRYDPDFSAQLQTDLAGNWSAEQAALYGGQRNYVIAVWNRFSEIEVKCLSSAMEGGEVGGVDLGINHPGIKVVEYSEVRQVYEILGINVYHHWIMIIIVPMAAAILPIIFIENKIILGLVIGFGILFGSWVAAVFVHLRRRLKRILFD
jgi:hypothetical protein